MENNIYLTHSSGMYIAGFVLMNKYLLSKNIPTLALIYNRRLEIIMQLYTFVSY